MPEGDVVFRTANRLNEALQGDALRRAELRWGSLDGSGLVGHTTVEVVSRGKHLLHRVAGGWTIHSHLRMEGSWRIWPASSRGRAADPAAHSHVRAVLAGGRWLCLGLRLGMLDLIRTAEESTCVGHLGPDLLGPDWDRDLALHNLRADPTVPIGQALLDQRLLAGIGTMYAAETLFLRRTFPWTHVGELTDTEVLTLIDTARRLLQIGTTQAVQSTTGSTRKGEELYVHARSGRPCRRCGDTIRVAPIGVTGRERTMFSCPSCQGGLAPGDTGRRQRPMGSSGGRRTGLRPQ